MKTIKDHSDRELLEKIAVNAKAANDSASFVKNMVVLTLILTIISIVISFLS